MITNERQLRITKSQIIGLEKAIYNFDIKKKIKEIGSIDLAKAELDALKSEFSILSEQINNYETLKSGAFKILEANTLDELPILLIKARISQNLSQRELAKRMGIKEQQIQRYESEKYASANLKRLIEIAEALSLKVSEIAEITDNNFRHSINETSNLEENWRLFPIKEMYQRGWFENFFTGTHKDAIENSEFLIKSFFKEAGIEPSVSMHRKRIRTGSRLNPFSLLAWEARIRQKAKKNKLIEFKSEFIDENWIDTLVKLSQQQDGPLLAKEHLEKSGISFIIEPHLPGTYLDGAALLVGRKPVIAMTLRYDRIDNFWFVLLHEICHIHKHIKKGKFENIFDDLESEGDEIEIEADNFAFESLIPNSIWETALPRYVQTESSVLEFAAKNQLHPAIIAGRIRKESENYIILKSMVGSGKVRLLFTDVNFGF